MMMEAVLDANECVLIAQVRKAEASHKMDTTTNVLRGKHHQGPSTVVYLGDVAKALLAHLAHPETPTFPSPPGYNEQRWVMETTSSELHVRIESHPYWGFGLFTSGYLNIITLRGPLQARSRLVLDIISSLGQSPWEMAHARSAERFLAKHAPGLQLKNNERLWNNLRNAGRATLKEAIEQTVERHEALRSALNPNEEQRAWIEAFEDDLQMAWRAHAEDNAPGIERALARMEAAIIHLDPALEMPSEALRGRRFSSTALPTPRTFSEETVSASDLLEEDEVPFVDLSSSVAMREEE
jgi:hypothetical protein